jgi:hypothetical protein
MSIYNGPPRAGARGGAAEFSWDNVKADVDRTYYLGHSVKALAGRWQKNKDVYWYTKEKQAGETSLADEIRAVKQAEEDAMMEVRSHRHACQLGGTHAPHACMHASREGPMRLRHACMRDALHERQGKHGHARMFACTQALGFKPKSVKPLAPAALNEQEMKDLLKRGRDHDDEGQAGAATLGVPGVGEDKQSGLGFAA